MCAISVIMGYGLGMNEERWSLAAYRSFQDMLKKAREFDIITGEPDCVDPKKEILIEKLEARFGSPDA